MSRTPLRRAAGPALVTAAVLVGSALPLAGTAHAVPGESSTVFLNEIHYDNDGTDSAELVEIAVSDGTSLQGWTLVRYNGKDGAAYGTTPLGGTAVDNGSAFVVLPVDGLQNGSPDGVALVDASGALVQFLSYEGAFTATSGPAAGRTSTDIGVAEPGSTPVGQSLQLTGTGSTYGDFTWTGPVAASPGEANTGQVLAVTVPDPDRVTPVHEVQGDGAVSPLVGQDITIEGVATSLITSLDALDGFYVQERIADDDPDTSEGVYVFCRAMCPADLAGGDLVRVTGTVAEFEGTTQVAADAQGSTITVLARGQALPAAAVVTLPADGSTRDAATFEPVEGMRTTISTTLAVAEYFALARYGELVLEAGERSFQYTQLNAPDAEGYADFLAELATRRIVLDDDSNDQNDATTAPVVDEPYYYPTPGLSTDNHFRGGDTITGLTGVMEHSFGAWRLRPVAGEDYTFTSANPRPAEPDDVGGRLTVASFNVLNYFADIDTTSSTREGTCGPAGTLDCRGADSEAERLRQLDKIVAALATIEADIFGLIEVQNDSGEATRQIVDALNAEVGAGTYAHVDTGVIGTDAIKQAFVYDTRTVRPVGGFELLTSSDDPRFVDTRSRPSLIQTFEEISTGERLTVSVNHLKSKGSGCGAGDDSPADGSGNCDLTRTNAAQALVDHLATDPTGSGDPDFLIIGDLNSYAQERPIAAIEGAGYTDLLEQFEGEQSYGYVFNGLLGDLDHALASASLLPQVTGAGGWDINADETPLFDYNDTVRDAGEAAFERESFALPLYEANAYRSSDHDPVIVGLALSTPNRAPVAELGGPYRVRVGRTIVLDATGSRDPDRSNELSYAWDLDGDGRFDDATGPTVVYRGTRGPFPRSVAVQVSDGALTSVDRATVVVFVPGRRS